MEHLAPVTLKIPRQRVGVLIGRKGEIKKRIEKIFKSKLEVTSLGDITIKSDDPIKLLRAKDVIVAISRGFSPEVAMLLKNERYVLEIMHLPEYVGNRETALMRHKARLIGTKGKVRANIEEATGAKISIYGKTVALIGSPEDVKLARHAVEKLVSGRTHKAVYSFLEKRKGDIYE